MNYIGSLATTGGPLCIIPAELAAEWNGTTSDYWELMESAGPRPAMLARYVNHEGVCVVAFQTETGSVSVFASGSEFAVIEVLRAGESFQIDGFAFRAEGLALGSQPLRIAGLGGRMVLFDSTLDGKTLELESLSHGSTARTLDPAFAIPDTVLLEVDGGTWQATEFVYDGGEDEDVQLRGVWFQGEREA